MSGKMYQRKLENVREQAQASWALAGLHRRIYFSCIRSVGLPPHPGLDVNVHKRQVIPGPWLLAHGASGMHLSTGGPPSDPMWGSFQLELGGAEPGEGEARRRKIGELSEKHVVGQFNQG